MKTRWAWIFVIFVVGCSPIRLPERTSIPYKSYNILHGLEADVIVRDYNTNLHLVDSSRARLEVEKVFTVLNEGGREQGVLVLPYDSFRDIKKLSGAIYDSRGEIIRSLSDNDLRDLPATSSWSLYEDNRVKIAELYHDRYPYTIVYKYEISFDGLLNLPTWYPQEKGEFVEQATFNIFNPSNVKVKSKGLEKKISRNKMDRDSVYSWNVRNLDPIEDEPLDLPFYQKAPHVLIAAQSFEMGKTSGNTKSWENFGSWYFNLSHDLDQLPEKTISEVKSIFNSATDRKEGIEKLYKYMQSRTRYVSVQLGIGGWKPFPAEYVDKRGYGDCKALTNYMQSILKIVDVPSYPVLIRNGYGAPDLVKDFPSNQFNHVVLYVPGKEPIWLESTSQSMPFNYIGNSNSDRYGLLVKPDSSYLIKTPAYDYQTNKLTNDVELAVNTEGEAEISIESVYSGAYLEKVIRNTAQKSNRHREKWLHDTIDLNGFKLTSYDFSDIDNKKRASSVHINIVNQKYATRTGSRLFVPLNKINRWPYQFSKTEEKRDYDVKLPFSFEETDYSTISLPEGFDVESIPNDIKIETDFGAFSLEIREKGKGTLKVVRNLKIERTHFIPEEYSDLRMFFVEIGNIDNKNIVLRSK